MNITTWTKKYNENTPLTMLTAHDAQMAQLISTCGIDAILVGDSLMHTFQGQTSTVNATIDIMAYHTKAVASGAPKAFIISDMPFMSCNISATDTLINAKALIQAGAHAIKCEVIESNLELVHRLVNEGFLVMGHIGCRPQYVNKDGGYIVHGGDATSRYDLMSLASALSTIGVFGIVLEKVAISTAKAITESVKCPTIGIGSGPHCSGQVLVTNDALGLTQNFNPTFLKQFCNGSDVFKAAINQYKTEVESNEYPTEAHGYES